MKKLESIQNELFNGFEKSEISDLSCIIGGNNTTVDNCSYDGDHCGKGSDDSGSCNDGYSDDPGGNEDDAK